MLKNSRPALYFLAMALPVAFFLSLPWNPQNCTRELMNYFFGADCWRVLQNLNDSDSVGHYRDKVHPYFSLFAVSLGKLSSVFFSENAVFLVYRMIFGVGGFFLFWIVVYKEADGFTAFAATLLLMSTATVRVWSVIPETFIFGFFSLMLAVYLIRIKADPLFVVLVSLSGTVTNVVLGVLYFFNGKSIREGFFRRILVLLLAIAALSVFQKAIYPTSVHFFGSSALQEERGYINRSLASIPSRAFDFFYSGFVFPVPVLGSDVVPSKFGWTDEMGIVGTWTFWSDFFSDPVGGYGLGATSLICLVLVLVSSMLVYSMYRYAKGVRVEGLSGIVLLFIAFQLCLHMLYGDFPFLYSFHFVPLIVLFIALQFPRNVMTPAALLLLAVALQLIQGVQLPQIGALLG